LLAAEGQRIGGSGETQASNYVRTTAGCGCIRPQAVKVSWKHYCFVVDTVNYFIFLDRFYVVIGKETGPPVSFLPSTQTTRGFDNEAQVYL
jgi:hypothetical protein